MWELQSLPATLRLCISLLRACLLLVNSWRHVLVTDHFNFFRKWALIMVFGCLLSFFFFSIHAQEVFNLIGSTFEDLDDQYSPSYSKRISILQTFDLIDAWELPVEFNNYPLLLKMPQTFLTTIRYVLIVLCLIFFFKLVIYGP